MENLLESYQLRKMKMSKKAGANLLTILTVCSAFIHLLQSKAIQLDDLKAQSNQSALSHTQ